MSSGKEGSGKQLILRRGPGRGGDKPPIIADKLNAAATPGAQPAAQPATKPPAKPMVAEIVRQPPPPPPPPPTPAPAQAAPPRPPPGAYRPPEGKVVRGEILPPQAQARPQQAPPQQAVVRTGLPALPESSPHSLLLAMSARHARPTLMGLLRQLLGRKPRLAPGEAAPFTVLLAVLAGDLDNSRLAAIYGALADRPGLAIKLVPQPFTVGELSDAHHLAGAGAKARQVLSENGADLLICGDAVQERIRLRFAPAGGGEESRPGDISLATRLELPALLDGTLAELLNATIMAALTPRGEAQRDRRRQLLVAAGQLVEATIHKPPVKVTPSCQLSLLTFCGHIAAALSTVDQVTDWHALAAEAYQGALKRADRETDGIELALLHRHLALIYSTAAEQKGADPESWGKAAKAWRAVCEALPRQAFPVDWAGAQVRLGLAQYKLALATGSNDVLKDSFVAYQTALQVFTRADMPARWADTMHNLAIALEVYGDHTRNGQVLAKAVEACRSILDIRPREKNPQAWAATQNTLGSALFLLDKHADGTDHLAESAHAFTQALEVYRALGLPQPAQVTEKNLAKVATLARQRRDRPVARPKWSRER